MQLRPAGWRRVLTLHDRQSRLILSHTVLEGHRFAVRPIEKGASLLSWSLPFGIAQRLIGAGDYVVNEATLVELRSRNLNLEMPSSPNFSDVYRPFQLGQGHFEAGRQVSSTDCSTTFEGYLRSSRRGVGTRNFVVLLATNSRASSFVRLLAQRFRRDDWTTHGLDGIVAVAHTEGGECANPNNLRRVLRTLAGFVVHPNVAAALVVDSGRDVINNGMVRQFLETENYLLREVPHEFMTLEGPLERGLTSASQVIESWLEKRPWPERTRESVSHLKLALQCGGSDAFSGVSANPLVGCAARELIRCGGSANLAETDELIGAEPYVLANVRDRATAEHFLEAVQRFRIYAERHGHSAEGNPSGGNRLRGLYNIAVKSIGAAQKRHPEVRLDYSIDYSERMSGPGFYFMDSPGNDLESVAGQVASGSNIVIFTTGNGSVTNFPFVPTIKVMSTSKRFRLLSREMDVDAGRVLEGEPVEDLGIGLFERTVKVASGEKTAGERAGHSQVAIWRNWRRTASEETAPGSTVVNLTGGPLTTRAGNPALAARIEGVDCNCDQVGLVLPNSLCSGEVARMLAERLNRKGIGRGKISRFVSLVHTEGCGVSSGHNQELLIRTLLGYSRHPNVGLTLFLEHGCEKTHNEYLRSFLSALELSRIGFASIQMDGGMDNALNRAEHWFEEALEGLPKIAKTAEFGKLRVGLASLGALPGDSGKAFGEIACSVVEAGGVVVIPEDDGLCRSHEFVERTLSDQRPRVTLGYGNGAEKAGLYIMECPTKHWVETLTGLGATGVHVVVGHVSESPVQGNPLVPLLQVGTSEDLDLAYGQDLDLFLQGDPARWSEALCDLIARTGSGAYSPRLLDRGFTDFQVTRGPVGISL